MKTKLFILILITTWSLTAVAQNKLSYDGYYRTQADSLNPFRYYLRFYEDGTVISITTAGKPENLLRWFKKGHESVATGNYILKDNTISFTLTSKEGKVSYEGVLYPENKLVLNVKSLINKYEAREEYYFLKMDGIN